MFDEEYPEEHQAQIWKAGEIVSAGTYMRITDHPIIWSHLIVKDHCLRHLMVMSRAIRPFQV